MRNSLLLVLFFLDGVVTEAIHFVKVKISAKSPVLNEILASKSLKRSGFMQPEIILELKECKQKCHNGSDLSSKNPAVQDFWKHTNLSVLYQTVLVFCLCSNRRYSLNLSDIITVFKLKKSVYQISYLDRIFIFTLL